MNVLIEQLISEISLLGVIIVILVIIWVKLSYISEDLTKLRLNASEQFKWCSDHFQIKKD